MSDEIKDALNVVLLFVIITAMHEAWKYKAVIQHFFQ